VAGYERGITNGIMPYPWESETCIGGWHYDRSLFNQLGEFGGYQNPGVIIHWLIDTVSKNGTFILNVPGKPDGTIDGKEIAVLDRITTWIQMNGEAIYATRPWKIFGEGPAMLEKATTQRNGVGELGPEDIRFTRNKTNTVVYAIVMGWPGKETVIHALGTASAQLPGKVVNVELLGYADNVRFTQDASALHVQLPVQKPCDYAIALKVTLLND
jgi:alpha-L-fucosidase